MSEFKGTPGKWSVDCVGDVCAGDYVVAICRIGVNEEESEDANARLIAAALDLLEALEPFAALLDAIELQSNGPKRGVWYSCESSVVGIREISMEDFAAARAAIAKALQS